ncbi:MAG: HEAT repeat domain-containing protein [Planctomycetia bacterium]|nr:HEAT repeat domain-containing protein [Planctomycetia bacterium]
MSRWCEQLLVGILGMLTHWCDIHEATMFGLFTPKCPLELADKTWTERRMLWFAQRLGLNRMLKARVILPTADDFPDKYNADYPSIRKCLDRMCGYMEVDPGSVTLEILPDEMMPNAAGLYEMRAKGNICIALSQLLAPPRLLATLAHELAHEILLRGGYLTGQEPDHERVTDLLPAFLGTGIFAANATIETSSGWDGGWSWWSISTQGYLSSFVFGYALALFAQLRGESYPEWAHHLRADARETLHKSLRFLRKTGDSLFTLDAAEAKPKSRTVSEVGDQLTASSPTLRLSALWDMAELDLRDPQLHEPVAHLLNDREPPIREAAARAIGMFGERSLDLVPQLTALLFDDWWGTRAAAAQSLGALKPSPKDVVEELARVLGDIRDYPACMAAAALSGYGYQAAEAVPRLLDALERALGTLDARTDILLGTLLAICPNPQQVVREHFGEHDPELLRQALHGLKKHGA